MKNRNLAVVFSSVFLIVLIWHFVAVALNSSVIFPEPYEVLKEFVSLFTKPQFVRSIAATVIRALESFVIIFLSGTVLGLLAGVFPVFDSFLKPFVSIFKATPVMSIILIAFFWFSSSAVPVFSAFLMAFPVMYIQTFQGYGRLDKKLDCMCLIYGIKGRRKLKYFTLPSMIPYLVTGAKQSLSMVWKVVIAAEVLTFPENGIGRGLQLAQMNLHTARVFAWTVVAVVLTAVSDFLFSSLLKAVKKRLRYET